VRGPRLRFAIDPGAAGLGIGAARDALFSWLMARSEAGAIVLRSDLSTEASGEAERRVIDDLLWLGLGWDEGIEAQGEQGPYRRSQRLHLYRRTAEDLLRRGLAYRCACPVPSARDGGGSPDRCACGRGTPAAAVGQAAGAPQILLRAGPDGEPGDLVLLQRGGGPGPEFATALDDAMMGITHVVSGPGCTMATVRQELLHAAIGEGTRPRSIELPPIDTAGDGSTGEGKEAPIVERCRLEGYPPEAVLNLLAHLGAATDVGQELLTREEMLAGFDRGRVAGERRTFDVRRLDNLARRHMARMAPERLAGLAAEHLANAGMLGDPPSTGEIAWAGAVARLFVDRLARMVDLPSYAEPLFRFDPGRCLADDSVLRTLREPQSRRVIETLIRTWADQADRQDLTTVGIRALVDAVRRTTGARGKPLYDAFRIALTGRSEGPDLAQLIALIERGSRLPLPRRVVGCGERARSLLAAIEGGGR